MLQIRGCNVQLNNVHAVKRLVIFLLSFSKQAYNERWLAEFGQNLTQGVSTITVVILATKKKNKFHSS